ncbi:uncharacterized protein CEXT_21691 [Caerostris extrusa]|uniref:Uncharacterized protein n=1 Tax=Caerostris extrusa TaxID=172846 RepID=A0AAV4XUC0_CAEEX|nr:uncharacterized protein CEXT_21691 [Caerostris extrusa]
MFINFMQHYINVGFQRCDDAKDFVEAQFSLSIENTQGQVYDKATSNSSEKFLRVPRPSTNECKGFKLMEDDVLVIKGSIDLVGCCILTTRSATFS